METLTSIDWYRIWLNTTYGLTILVFLRLLIQPKAIQVATFVMIGLGLGIVLFFVSEPIALYSDKWAYQAGFEAINVYRENEFSDYGFYLLNQFIGALSDSSEFFFLVVSCLYVSGYFIFIKKYFNEKHQFVVFLLTIVSLGFYGYGTNTIRQGIALSFFLIALANDKTKIRFILLATVAVLFHKSLLVPVLFYLLISILPSKINYLYFWIGCLVLTIAVSGIGLILGFYLVDGDARISEYLIGENESYKAGFKWNFLIYSIAPIVYGKYVLKKFNEPIYLKIFNLYLLVNAVWLLIIRLPFTDRFAYMSWVLMPFIFIYPLSKQKIFNHHNWIIAIILFVFATLNFLIS